MCCKQLEKAVGELQSLAGGGAMYHPAMRPSGQIERDDLNGSWNVNGCCGGGCYVLTDIKFCPFCGTPLPDGK